MKIIQKPWIKLKETIDQEDYDSLNKLQEQCIYEDQTALKLELDYKLVDDYEEGKESSIGDLNEFMYFDGQQVIGYIGICSFGGSQSPLEVNGMVHPKYRRQGIFKTLSELVMAEWRRRNLGSILLLSDRKSNAGQAFIKGMGAQYKHSEYEMYLKEGGLNLLHKKVCNITLRQATNADAYEVARQNAIYFRDECNDFQKAANNNELDNILEEPEIILSNEDILLPEEQAKRGMIIYLAETEQQIIGKIHLQLTSGVGAIYGLGVLPKYRGKGFGRAILIKGIEKLKEAHVDEIMLQVAAQNANALNLYKGCGFVEASTMDYYEIRQERNEK